MSENYSLDNEKLQISNSRSSLSKKLHYNISSSSPEGVSGDEEQPLSTMSGGSIPPPEGEVDEFEPKEREVA
ncbi:hypothetical protein PIB30_075745 [Stylosanthes scabra]|uniref:Uncharacterized protein n=1 Tax=Stylosanthes scabra TaxID=79078 RepID=A0ABU6VNR1_9FABA|nr:hypothetical protein [Stylosanthes scabra]